MQSIKDIIDQGELFLTKSQWPDGSWRDYNLKPGPSEAWTTAVVGLTLAGAPSGPSYFPVLRTAARKLHALVNPYGWGYNGESVADADSTAWALRYLAAVEGVPFPAAIGMLERYLDEKGEVHTFLTSDSDSWGEAHPDVTPVVGLALIALGANKDLVDRLRRAVLSARNSNGTWSAFWWSVESYSNARCVEFLEASGRIPIQVAKDIRCWLDKTSAEASFDIAQRLTLATSLEGANSYFTQNLIELLCGMQLSDGSWPPSKVLTLPPHDTNDGKVHTVSDNNRLISSSAALYALKRWIILRATSVKQKISGKPLY